MLVRVIIIFLPRICSLDFVSVEEKPPLYMTTNIRELKLASSRFKKTSEKMHKCTNEFVSAMSAMKRKQTYLTIAITRECLLVF